MTEERDADLLALFAELEEDLPDGAFSHDVMARAGKKGRARPVAAIVLAVLAAAAFVVLLAGPLQFAALSIGELLAQPIIATDATPLAQLLAPANTIAIPVGLGLLCTWLIARKLFA